ncbi:MAG: hypothetical protein ABIN67_20135 [Ferruginibacter sp.]
MKILSITISIFITILTSCNNNNDSSKASDADSSNAAKEDTSSTLVDLSFETDIKKLLCQSWENKEDAEDATASGGGGSLEMPYRGYSFFADGSVTENPRDNIRVGKWKLNDAAKLIDIEFSKGKKAQYKIGAIGTMEMVLMNMADKKKTEYISDAKSEVNASDDPFYPTNNEWRIKPLKAENDSAIKLRTEQCILFYAKFLKDNVEHGDNTISFVGLPACFKWYSGGISVINKDKLEQKWINCFYNKEQALKAHAMLEKIISKKYKWDKEERIWVKQSAGVVMQMYEQLKSTSVAK